MKKYIIVLISVLFLRPQQTANGCGFNLLPEEYRVFLFNQSVLNKNELLPFFYSSEFFYNQNEHSISLEEENKNFYSKTATINATEWLKHTSYKGKINDVIQAVYKESLDSLMLGTKHYFMGQPFLAHLKKNYKAEFEYLKYAKECEFINDTEDAWGLQKNNDAFIIPLEKKGNEKLNKTNNEFLKIRYAYQLIKINFYAYVGNNAVSLYNKHIKPSSLSTWLKESAKFYVNQSPYVVGYEYGNEQPKEVGSAEWNYDLSLTFDKSIDKKMRCVQLFNRKSYMQYLYFAKNNHEKANIYVMYELQNPARSLINLKTIAELDPTNEYLPFLIAREINKLEDWMLTPELTKQQPSTFDYSENLKQIINIKSLSSKKYALDVYQFILKLNQKQPTDLATSYHLLASNCCILLQDKNKGYQHILQAEKQNTKLDFKFQIMLNKIALQFDGKLGLTKDIKQQLLNFEALNIKYPQLVVNQKIMVSQLYLFIGTRLLAANDVANGILFCSKTARPLGQIGYWTTKNYHVLLLEKAKPQHYDSLIALIDKPNKTAFEMFLLNRKDIPQSTRYTNIPDTIPLLKDKLLDYKSMYYVQQNQLDSALLCANKIAPNYWNQYPYNLFKCFPFITGHGNDYSSNNDFYSYDKRKYLQRMVSVKYLVDNKIGDVGKHCFVLANGYFNMGYHGNYWIMNMPYKLSSELQDGYYDLTNTNNLFLENYYGCKQAEYYYLKAFENTQDSSLAAICIDKANLCNQNMQELKWRRTAVYDENKYEWNKSFEINETPYKKLFLDKYNNQRFYDDFVSSCYYSYHLNKKFY